MKYDDLIGVPFKWGGRDKSGMDCWGIVSECCRRAGTPVADPFKPLDSSVDEAEALRAIATELNVRETAWPKAGGIVFCLSCGGTKSHVGYIVGRGRALHAVEGGGARVSPLCCFKGARFYEVTEIKE